MNEVVRTKAVPNPLKAFAVCCKVSIIFGDGNFELWTLNFDTICFGVTILSCGFTILKQFSVLDSQF